MNKLQLVICTVYHIILPHATTRFSHTKILLEDSLHVPTSLQPGNLTTDNVFWKHVCVCVCVCVCFTGTGHLR
jgi:hypothetical protein